MATSRPRSLILSFYGAFVRQLDGWIAVSHLLTLMAEINLDPQAVRSSMSRLKQIGWLAASRRNGAAGYALSSVARAALDAGDERIYGAQRAADLADGWAVVVFSVPEHRRADRHLLRSRLTWLGFGAPAPGVWIAPRRLLDPTRAMLESLGLAGYVDLFHATYTGFGDARSLVARCWDLDGLRAQYAEFIAVHRPVDRAWRQRAGSERDAFADYLAALDRWRGLPFLDPGLPAELLPPGWEGRTASELFARLRERLAGAALEHVRRVVEGPVARESSIHG